MLMMVCQEDHLEVLLNQQTPISKEGMISSVDDLPMSVLDLSKEDLESIRQYI